MKIRLLVGSEVHGRQTDAEGHGSSVVQHGSAWFLAQHLIISLDFKQRNHVEFRSGHANQQAFDEEPGLQSGYQEGVEESDGIDR